MKNMFDHEDHVLLNLEDVLLSGLKMFLSLLVIKDLLRVAATFWDPEFHVFQFRNRKLCLLCYPGFSLYCHPTLLTNSSNLSTLYHYSLGLDDESVTTILFGDEVDFVALISYLQKNGRAINNAFSHKAAILCLLGTFLFMGGTSNRSPAALLSVVEEMHCDRTPISLRLSYVWTDSIIIQISFSRAAHCCYRVQIWLLEHLRLIKIPKNMDIYLALDSIGFSLMLAGLVSRRMILPSVGWFVGDAYDTLSLMGRHFPASSFLGTYYFLTRLMRQCSYRHRIPAMDCHVPKVCKNEYSCVKSQKSYWLGFSIITVPSVSHSPHFSKQCLKWMTKCDAKLRKVIYVILISIKGKKEDDSSQNGKKIAKDPTSIRCPPLLDC
ncbi:hypothetical protein Cgig2_010843 [Carnegiea gigantea]|uniref:Uncharacterized protein n=1 Tax=Carnegiea gigantea TaxID=171969 RepID=A0A9Q1GR21_9CARY|nr:hypothetical protein Cgig2_010843 [Carnegiea gigantea]